MFGILFYTLYLRFLLYLAATVQRRLGVGWLIFGRWAVMPVLVVLSAYLVFGEVGVDGVIALAGYAASRALRWIKVQMDMALSDENMLDAIEASRRVSSEQNADVATCVRQIRR